MCFPAVRGLITSVSAMSRWLRPAGEELEHLLLARGQPARARTLAGRAAEQRAHAGEQLVGRERLHEVVVGAEQEPCHPVVRLRACARDEDDRQRRPVQLAQRPADLVARQAGKVDVEDREVGPFLPSRRQRLLAARHRRDLEIARAPAGARGAPAVPGRRPPPVLVPQRFPSGQRARSLLLVLVLQQTTKARNFFPYGVDRIESRRLPSVPHRSAAIASIETSVNRRGFDAGTTHTQAPRPPCVDRGDADSRRRHRHVRCGLRRAGRDTGDA